MCAKWKNNDAKAVIESVWDGEPHEARQRLFNHTSSVLTEYFEAGWKSPIFTKDTLLSEDLARYQAIQRNLYEFAASKAEKHVEALTELKNENRSDRMDAALELDNTFNGRYLASESIITRGVANGAREWRAIEQTAHIFPYVEWVTVMDGNTRHAKLNGITLPWDDPWWQAHPQPLDWGCRCRKRQLEKARPSTEMELAALPPQPPRPWHGNAWKQKAVWKTKEHPYGKSLSEQQKEAVTASIKHAIRTATAVDMVAYRSGGYLKASPFHGSSEMKANVETGMALARLDHRVVLRPVSGTKGEDYDAYLDNGRTEFKTPTKYAPRPMTASIAQASGQGAATIVFHLKQRMDPDRLLDAIKRAFGRTGPNNPKPRNSNISEVWVVYKNKRTSSERKLSEEFQATIKEWMKNSEGPPR